MPHTTLRSPSRRDSWPPTLVRLAPTIPKEYPSLDDIDDDPLTYFLTPAPDLKDAEENVDMMDFDAGIEDNSPRDIVRSVSPSTLDSLNKTRGRRSPPVPDLSDIATPDTDDDDDDDSEDYIRFAPQDFMVPFSLRDFAGDGAKFKSRPKPSDVLLSPPLFPPSRDWAPVRPGGRGRQRSVSFRHQRSQRVWREPSPDVWSIEEETEQELVSEMGSSIGGASDDKDIEAAKPRKKVRFLLPAME